MRAGQRVRVKTTANSRFAGKKGVVMFVGDTVCDVKFVERTREWSDIEIEAIPRTDLEDVNGRFELTRFEPIRPRATSLISRILIVSVSVLAVYIAIHVLF